MLEKLISSHIILEIGSKIPGYLFTEAIVDNPARLIELISESNYYIKEILWWVRTKIGVSSCIGAGGPPDPRAPTEYFFAETFISKEFDSNTTIEEYQEYIRETMLLYACCDLYPGFDIAVK